MTRFRLAAAVLGSHARSVSVEVLLRRTIRGFLEMNFRTFRPLFTVKIHYVMFQMSISMLP